MATASAPPTKPHRVELASERHAYELTIQPLNGITLRLEEAEHDAAVFLTADQAQQLRADLAAALQKLTPADPSGAIRSEAGCRVLEDVRRLFVALVEHDKLSASETDEVCRAIVQHVRSWRPYVLREVAGG